MTTTITTTTAKKYGRTAGLLYLFIITCGLFSEIAVRANIIVPGNAIETANNILASESLFRMGFISDLIMALCDITLAVVFYQLLKPVNKTLALLAASLRLIQTAIIGMNLLNHLSAVLILDNPIYIEAMGATEVYSRVMLYLEMHKYGYLISGVFFAFNCLVTGYLFIKSPYFPKILGGMLIAAGIGYLVNCAAYFIAPQLIELSEILLLLTAVTAELTVCIWLLVKGVKKK